MRVYICRKCPEWKQKNNCCKLRLAEIFDSHWFNVSTNEYREEKNHARTSHPKFKPPEECPYILELSLD